jgi:hypothetical protein
VSDFSDFGDIEPGDLADTDPPDPLTLARMIVRLERALSGDAARPAELEDMHPFEQALRVYVIAAVIARLVREWQKAPL